MKTLTLHINDNIYEDVKRFLAIFSPEKLQIETHAEHKTILSNAYLSKLEVSKMIAFFEKFNIPIPNNQDNISIVYNEDDLNTDLENLKRLKLLK